MFVNFISISFAIVYLSIGQLVGFLDGGGRSGGGHFLLKVESDVAELLLDVADDLTLGGGDHRVASLGHDLHEVVGQVTTGQVETQDGVGKGVTLVDGDGVRDAIADVEHQTGGTTGSVQGKHSLDAHVPGDGENERKLNDVVVVFVCFGCCGGNDQPQKRNKKQTNKQSMKHTNNHSNTRTIKKTNKKNQQITKTEQKP